MLNTVILSLIRPLLQFNQNDSPKPHFYNFSFFFNFFYFFSIFFQILDQFHETTLRGTIKSTFKGVKNDRF